MSAPFDALDPADSPTHRRNPACRHCGGTGEYLPSADALCPAVCPCMGPLNNAQIARSLTMLRAMASAVQAHRVAALRSRWAVIDGGRK